LGSKLHSAFRIRNLFFPLFLRFYDLGIDGEPPLPPSSAGTSGSVSTEAAPVWVLIPGHAEHSKHFPEYPFAFRPLLRTSTATGLVSERYVEGAVPR
jgi:hypothetical protein